jgi:hypothetical protein
VPPPCRYQNGPGGGEKVWVWDVLAINDPPWTKSGVLWRWVLAILSFMDTLTWAKITIPPDWVRVFGGVWAFGRFPDLLFYVWMDKMYDLGQKFVLG